MARDEKRQQDEIRQILYSEQNPRVLKRPEAQRPQQVKPVPRGISTQQKSQRGRVQSFEKAPYAGAVPRAKEPLKNVKPQSKSGAGTWLLLFVVILLFVIAGILLYSMMTGGLTGRAGVGTKTGVIAKPPEEALLPETADAGDAYVLETIFIGDSNFERLREFAIVEPSTVAAKVGIGIGSVTSDNFIEVTGKGEPLTIAQTVQAVEPRRILVMLGTNDVPNMTPQEFGETYKNVLKNLKKSASKASIVVAAIPPVAKWKDSEMLNASAVRQFNEVLLELCKKEGYAYLDSYGALADEAGYLPEAYTDDGYHLNKEALQLLMSYYRTHAYNP